ncbi:MAG: phosphatidylglycerophosphatase A [Candidatus Omnitrophota bacterium]
MIKLLAGFFGLGYLPAGGTVASVVSVVVYFLLRDNHPLYNILTLLSTLAALVVCGRAERAFGRKDPSQIVLDEISGMLVGFLFIPFSWSHALVGFIVFRFFDIVKVYPLKKIESFPGAWGVVLDDLCAGVYANFILRILMFFNLILASR